MTARVRLCVFFDGDNENSRRQNWLVIVARDDEDKQGAQIFVNVTKNLWSINQIDLTVLVLAYYVTRDAGFLLYTVCCCYEYFIQILMTALFTTTRLFPKYD